MRIPGKEEFGETLRYFRRRLEVLEVRVELGRRVTREHLEQQDFDDVIVATGVLPRTPRIEGIGHAKVLSYLDVLRHDVPVGPRVAIIGAGGIGFDIGEFLLHDPAVPLPVPLPHWAAEWGVDLSGSASGGLCPPAPERPVRKIYLLQRKASKVGAGLGKTSGWVHRATLLRKGVEMLGGVEYHKIDDAGLHIMVNGTARLLEVDHVIICAGQDSLAELMPVVPQPAGPRYHLIGGAALAAELDAKRAIRQGAEVAAGI